ncbi:cell division protein FtsQ/DivIB [Chenggangzhangella methanolivorans]|uniref:Cell division protein FtsQ n=2 Tax=Chenggangzhangella methanolivorans TaxID=1437009 RepID=A0A9E6RAM5_9HYPH|nr:cell division protein FtsQ/DivIB [Chenggangzhangella methanolivorans]QZO00865.1 cell division protein FtsQ/DivIB [Chenggangzhangella methanolivorans]
MRAAGEARVQRPDIDDVDEVIGASRWSSLRFRLERVARKRRLGLALVAVLYGGTGLLGMIDGGHWPTVRDEILNAHVTTANLMGFRITAVQTEGQVALTDDEVLLALGVKDDTALPFLDVRAARERLMANPLVQDATVKKLYPDRLTVNLVERKPFALWQHDGKVQILAEDGTPIDEFRDSRFAHLPLVVGPSANLKAQKLLDALALAPKIREETYAAVFVAERRWNLRLRSGVEVKLPEIGYAAALARLESLQAKQNVFAKWINVVDLRSPAKIVVRLSPEAAAQMAEADKAAAKAKKKAGQI